jgi:AraC family transcriptional regulator of adaptative response/methylated-DNA-[protein]-cysteine methyltransferase
MSFDTKCKQYELIEKALLNIVEHQPKQTSVEQIARSCGVTALQLQQTLNEWAGVSVQQALQFLTRESARQLLQQSSAVVDSALLDGLSGSKRLHNTDPVTEVLTSSRHKNADSALTIHYAWHASPFGTCFIAISDHGVCQLSFCDPAEPEAMETLHAMWPQANKIKSEVLTAPSIAHIFEHFTHKPARKKILPLHIKGTPFQLKVWKALMNIPPASLCSYQQIARSINKPAASRAVGSAVGANPISFIIPCHRVIRSCGTIGQYHWGSEKKQAMLLWERYH